MTTEAKLLPTDIEAEKSIIGSLLISAAAGAKTVGMLEADDFYRTANREIYATFLEMYKDNIPVDLVTMTSALRKKKKLKDVGGAAYLSELVNRVPTAVHVEHYAKIVKEKAIFRKAIEMSERLGKYAMEGSLKALDFLSIWSDETQSLYESLGDADTPDLSDTANEYLVEIASRLTGNGEGAPWCYYGLSRYLDKMTPGTYNIIAARPSVGKTQLGFAITKRLIKMGRGVLYLSMEMPPNKMIDRYIADELSIDTMDLAKGRLTDEQTAQIGHKIEELKKLPLYLAPPGEYTVEKIRSLAERIRAKKRLDLITIDYISYISGNGKSLYEELTKVSKQLKIMAMSLGIPILVLSQFNRDIEKRENPIPRLADLKDSSSLEQDGDTILLLHKDPDKPNELNVNIAKAKYGITGYTKLISENQFSRIKDHPAAVREFYSKRAGA